MELKETKELKAMSKALKNYSNNYSIVKKVGIIYVSAYIVAITFVTVKKEIETEIETVRTQNAYGSLIAEFIEFEINVVIVGTKMDIMLVRIEIDIILIGNNICRN